MTDEEIIKRIDERRDFVTYVDGFVYYWPTTRGHHSTHVLRVIADELEKRDKPWEEIIARDFNGVQEETGPSEIKS